MINIFTPNNKAPAIRSVKKPLKSHFMTTNSLTKQIKFNNNDTIASMVLNLRLYKLE